jgi:hypothetical protein
MTPEQIHILEQYGFTLTNRALGRWIDPNGKAVSYDEALSIIRPTMSDAAFERNFGVGGPSEAELRDEFGRLRDLIRTGYAEYATHEDRLREMRRQDCNGSSLVAMKMSTR